MALPGFLDIQLPLGPWDLWLWRLSCQPKKPNHTDSPSLVILLWSLETKAEADEYKHTYLKLSVYLFTGVAPLGTRSVSSWAGGPVGRVPAGSVLVGHGLVGPVSVGHEPVGPGLGGHSTPPVFPLPALLQRQCHPFLHQLESQQCQPGRRHKKKVWVTAVTPGMRDAKDPSPTQVSSSALLCGPGELDWLWGIGEEEGMTQNTVNPSK